MSNDDFFSALVSLGRMMFGERPRRGVGFVTEVRRYKLDGFLVNVDFGFTFAYLYLSIPKMISLLEQAGTEEPGDLVGKRVLTYTDSTGRVRFDRLITGEEGV